MTTIDIERRHEKRIPVFETGFLESMDTKGDTIRVQVTDVSFRGVGLEAKSIVETNKDFMVKYSILLQGFKCPVEVKWTNQKGTGYSIGCHKKAV